MENPTLIETLIDKAEAYGKTSLSLFTATTVLKSADITSNIVSRLVIALIMLMVILLASIGLAIWIGNQLGDIAYGFFAVACGYLFFALLCYLLRGSLIKTPVSNFIISRLQKK